MIKVFLQLYFKMFREFLWFIADRFIKEWEYLFQKGRIYGDSERGDFYVKEIVDNLTEERGDEHDPYVIDERMYSLFRVPLLAEAMHLGTYIDGLKSLHRADICAISRKDGEQCVIASLGAGPLVLRSKIIIELAHIERILAIKISINYCKVHANFSIDPRTGRNGTLQSVYIDELSGVGFSIEGFGLWLYLPSLFVTLLMKLLKSLVRNIVEFKLEKHLEKVIQSYQFPIEGTILISEHASVDNNELGEFLDDSESTTKDYFNDPSFGSNVSHTSKQEPIWCTNLPWFENIVEEQNMCNDESDGSDISIQFQFSKDNVNQEDIEPLTRSERPTCCIFFRKAQTSEAFKNLAEAAEYEDLKDEKLCLNSRSEVEFEDCSPVKYSKDFWGLLKKEESPVVLGVSNLSENKGTIPCDLETTEGEIDKLIRRFLGDYPKFVAFIRHSEEIAASLISNEKSEIDSDIKIQTDSSNIEEYATSNDKRDSSHLEAGSQNKSNQIGISMRMENADEFSEAKYIELCELKTAYLKKTVECCELYKASFNLDYSSLNREVKLETEDFKQDIANNFKQISEKFDPVLKNEDFLNQRECLLDKDRTLAKNPVERSSIVEVKTLKDSNLMKHVESILKWDSQNSEKGYPFKSENIGTTRKMSSQNSTSSLISDYFEETRLLKPTLVNTDERCNTDKTIMSLKISPDLKENNTIKSSVKYDTRTAIERLNTIGDNVYRCFDNAYSSCKTQPVSAFYFPDSESTTFFELYESKDFQNKGFQQIALHEDGLTQKIHQNEKNYGINNNLDIFKTFEDLKSSCNTIFNDLTNLFPKKTPVATAKTMLNLLSEPLNEKRQFSSESSVKHLLQPLNEGNYLIERELMSDIGADTESVPNCDTIDDDFFLEWVSDVDTDDPSVDVSTDSDKEEVDVGKTILCEEFKYTTNCVESETKLADPSIGVEKMERPSLMYIADTDSNSSTSNTEIFHLKDSINNLNRPSPLNNARDIPIAYLDITPNIDFDSLVRLDEETKDSSNWEAFDRSIESLPECTNKFALEKAYPKTDGDYDADYMKITESDNTNTRTSEDESSVELCKYAPAK